MPRAPRTTRLVVAALAAAGGLLALPSMSAAAPPTCSVPPGSVLTITAGETIVLPTAPCNDPDGDPIQIEITRRPEHGTLSPDGTLPLDAARSFTATSAGADAVGFRALAGGERSDEYVVPIVVSEPAGRVVVVIPAVRFSWDAPGYGVHGTLFRKLALKGIPARSTVRIRCFGATCPRMRQRFSRARDTIRLRRFTGTHLAVGTRIEAVVTSPGVVGVVKTLRVRRSREPAVTERCMPPGETQRRSCDPNAPS